MTIRSPITWMSEWETGHAEVDGQHKTLVESLNRLQAAILVGSGDEELGWCLSFLKAYTRVHFRTEEALMAACPGFDGTDHVEAHRALLTQVDEQFRRYMRGETHLTQEMLDVLKQWLLDHICGADQELVRRLRDHPADQEAPQTAK